MKHLIPIYITMSVIITGTMTAMAIEEAKYEVIREDGDFEIRDYAPYILAETIVDESLEDAGNTAFHILFRYISGSNKANTNITMTAPVSQEPAGKKIEMTAPVGQQHNEKGWAVSFMMPADYTLETLPQPDDPKITLRQVPACRMAAIRYSGFWSEKRYLQYKSKLESWIHKNGLTVTGVPVWARYNPPFMPWFLRRNEILIPIDKVTDPK